MQAALKRALKIGLTDTPITRAEWEHTVAAFDHNCAYCGKQATLVEHVTPVSRSGKTTRDNCVPACKNCNLRKGKNALCELLGNRMFCKNTGSTPAALERISAWLAQFGGPPKATHPSTGEYTEEALRACGYYDRPPDPNYHPIVPGVWPPVRAVTAQSSPKPSAQEKLVMPDPRVEARVSVDIYALIEDRCQKTGLSPSAILRDALQQYFYGESTLHGPDAGFEVARQATSKLAKAALLVGLEAIPTEAKAAMKWADAELEKRRSKSR